ncbi:hypothetical protein FRX31_012990, partial [Thalictrum thalictroides]
MGERRNSLDIQDQGGNRNSNSIQIRTSKGLHGSMLEESNLKGSPTTNADFGDDEEEIAIIETEVIKMFGEGSLEKLRRKRSIFSNQDSTGYQSSTSNMNNGIQVNNSSLNAAAAEKTLLEALINGKKLGLPTDVETSSTQCDEGEVNQSKEDQVTTDGRVSHEDHGAGRSTLGLVFLVVRLDAKCIHKPVKPVKKVATWVENEHAKVENDHIQKQQPFLIEDSNTEVSTKEHGDHAEPQQGLNGDEHEWQSPTKHKAQRHSNEGTDKATGGSIQGRFEALKGMEVSEPISLTTKERVHDRSDTLSLITKEGVHDRIVQNKLKHPETIRSGGVKLAGEGGLIEGKKKPGGGTKVPASTCTINNKK